MTPAPTAKDQRPVHRTLKAPRTNTNVSLRDPELAGQPWAPAVTVEPEEVGTNLPSDGGRRPAFWPTRKADPPTTERQRPVHITAIMNSEGPSLPHCSKTELRAPGDKAGRSGEAATANESGPNHTLCSLPSQWGKLSIQRTTK